MVCIIIKLEMEEPVDEDEMICLMEKLSHGVGYKNTAWWIMSSDEEAEIIKIVEDAIESI